MKALTKLITFVESMGVGLITGGLTILILRMIPNFDSHFANLSAHFVVPCFLLTLGIGILIKHSNHEHQQLYFWKSDITLGKTILPYFFYAMVVNVVYYNMMGDLFPLSEFILMRIPPTIAFTLVGLVNYFILKRLDKSEKKKRIYVISFLVSYSLLIGYDYLINLIV